MLIQKKKKIGHNRKAPNKLIQETFNYERLSILLDCKYVYSTRKGIFFSILFLMNLNLNRN